MFTFTQLIESLKTFFSPLDTVNLHSFFKKMKKYYIIRWPLVIIDPNVCTKGAPLNMNKCTVPAKSL